MRPKLRRALAYLPAFRTLAVAEAGGPRNWQREALCGA